MDYVTLQFDSINSDYHQLVWDSVKGKQLAGTVVIIPPRPLNGFAHHDNSLAPTLQCLSITPTGPMVLLRSEDFPEPHVVEDTSKLSWKQFEKILVKKCEAFSGKVASCVKILLQTCSRHKRTLSDCLRAIELLKKEENVIPDSRAYGQGSTPIKYKSLSLRLVCELIARHLEVGGVEDDTLPHVEKQCETKLWHIRTLEIALQKLHELGINSTQELQSTLQHWEDDLDGEYAENSYSINLAREFALEKECTVIIGYVEKQNRNEAILRDTAVIVNRKGNVVANYGERESHEFFAHKLDGSDFVIALHIEICSDLTDESKIAEDILRTETDLVIFLPGQAQYRRSADSTLFSRVVTSLQSRDLPQKEIAVVSARNTIHGGASVVYGVKDGCWRLWAELGDLDEGIIAWEYEGSSQADRRASIVKFLSSSRGNLDAIKVFTT